MLPGQVVGFEIDTPEDGSDGEGLAVGQMADLRDHDGGSERTGVWKREEGKKKSRSKRVVGGYKEGRGSGMTICLPRFILSLSDQRYVSCLGDAPLS